MTAYRPMSRMYREKLAPFFKNFLLRLRLRDSRAFCGSAASFFITRCRSASYIPQKPTLPIHPINPVFRFQ